MSQDSEKEPLKNQEREDLSQIDVPPAPPRSFMNRNPIMGAILSTVPFLGGYLLYNTFKEGQKQKAHNDALAAKLGEDKKQDNPKIKSWSTKSPLRYAIIGNMLPIIGWAAWSLSQKERETQRSQTKILQEEIKQHNIAKRDGQNIGNNPASTQRGNPGQAQGQGAGTGVGQGNGKDEATKQRESDLKKSWFTRNPGKTAGLCFLLCCTVVGVIGAAAIAIYTAYRSHKEGKAKRAAQKANNPNPINSRQGAPSNGQNVSHKNQIDPRSSDKEVNNSVDKMRSGFTAPTPMQPSIPSSVPNRRLSQAQGAKVQI